MSRLTLLSGVPGSGKTTFLLEQLFVAQLSPVGVICPARFEEGQKTGIVAWLLPGSERLLLARPRDSLDSVPSDDVGLYWVFDNEVMERINQHLRSLEALPTPEVGSPLLIIDEIGPLELVHNRGFTEALRLLDAGVYPEALVVVNLELIDVSRDRWCNVYDTVEVVEV